VTAFGWELSTQTAVRSTCLGTRQALGSETTIAAGPGLAQRNSRFNETFKRAGLAPAVFGVATPAAVPIWPAEAEAASTAVAASARTRTRTCPILPKVERA
jgi:hypothetical protein